MPWSVAFMVVMIVLITAIAKTARTRHQSIGHRDASGRSADAMQAEQEIRQLKERIAVLERVVTENHGSLDLDRQIERLRDR